MRKLSRKSDILIKFTKKKMKKKISSKKNSKSLIKLSNNVHNCIKLCTYMNKYVKNIYTKFGLILLNRYGVNNFFINANRTSLGW